MNIESIDAKLNQWKDDLAKLHANMTEMQGLYGYQLAGDGSSLSGTTKLQYDDALVREAKIWKNYEFLSNLLTTISEKRNGLGFFPRESALSEIEEMFEGDSIELPGDEIELQKRDLFSTNFQVDRTSARRIREEMKTDFHAVCDFYVRLESRWQQLSEDISSIKAEADRIIVETSQLIKIGSIDPAPLPALVKQLQVVNSKWRSDPLGITKDIKQELSPYLRHARVYVTFLANESKAIIEEIKHSKIKVEEIATKESEARNLYEQCLSKFEFASGTGPKLPPSSQKLLEHSQKLHSLFEEKNWTELGSALKIWRKLYNQISSDTNLSLTTNKGIVEKKATLRQRFLEAVAKYKDYSGRGMAIPKSITTFTERGQELLKGKSGKIDLGATETIVVSLEVKVGELCLKFDSESSQS